MLQDIDKKKYLVPSDLTVGSFIHIIRMRLVLPSEKEKDMHLFVNRGIPSSSELLSSLYEKHCDSDGFLYTNYSDDHVFVNEEVNE
jgi:GABA(A) receptor-associated protein